MDSAGAIPAETGDVCGRGAPPHAAHGPETHTTSAAFSFNRRLLIRSETTRAGLSTSLLHYKEEMVSFSEKSAF